MVHWLHLCMSQSAALTEKTSLSRNSRHALKALLYFDIFSYPLTQNEIHRFMGSECDEQALSDTLDYLTEQGLTYRHGSYFSVSNEPDWVEKRERGNAAARQMMKTAYRFSRFISRFPYVRGVAISGSLSKGYLDDLGDIDYFIVTKPGRLWIARTLLIGFKKVFLLNSKKYFCVNYFVDTDHLEIPDKNIFTATELLTLIPVYDPNVHKAFLQQNLWAYGYLPNYTSHMPDHVFPEKRYPIKAAMEALLNGGLGERLDSWFMTRTMQRWKNKFEHFTSDYFDHALRSRKYVSKHHPQNFQLRVLNALSERVKEFEARHHVKLEVPHD